MAGAKVVLCDVSKDNLLINIESLRKALQKTKAIIPVHISGRGSNIIEILQVAKKHKIKVIEDAAVLLAQKL